MKTSRSFGVAFFGGSNLVIGYSSSVKMIGPSNGRVCTCMTAGVFFDARPLRGHNTWGLTVNEAFQVIA